MRDQRLARTRQRTNWAVLGAALAVLVFAAGCQRSGAQGQGSPVIGAATPARTSSASTSSAPPNIATSSTAPPATLLSPATSTAAHGIRMVDGQPEPDRTLTPGSVFAGVGVATICVSGYTARVRDVPLAEREQVFASYAIPYADRASYELDHLVPLEGGGNNTPDNLWPERGAIPNLKDGLENRLHALVCGGQLDLATAQRAIATDWVAAYHRYGGEAYQAPASPSRAIVVPVPHPVTASSPPTAGAYYANCAAARAAGVAPLHRGQPGYRAALDRDGDGVACE